jgi:hypothetical protein
MSAAQEHPPLSSLDEDQRKFFSFWEGTKRGVLALERKHFNDPERQDLHDYIAHEKDLRRAVIAHDHPYRTAWDALITCFIIYTAIAIPFYIGFDVPLSPTAQGIEILITVLFGLDMLLNFNTSYVDGETEKVVVRRRQIAQHYLQTWFVVDFISTFPFDAVLQLHHAATADSSSTWAAIRLVRVLRLVRLGRLYHAMTQSTFWRDRLPISPAVLALSLLLMQIFYVTHLFACFWHFISLSDAERSHTSGGGGGGSDQYRTNWRESFGFALSSTTIGQRYVASIYYVLVTMATIGYGDIYPTNDLERLFGVFTILTGVIVLSMLVNRVTSVLATINPLSSAYEQQLEQLKASLKGLQLPFHLRRQAKVRASVPFSSLSPSLSSLSSYRLTHAPSTPPLPPLPPHRS